MKRYFEFIGILVLFGVLLPYLISSNNWVEFTAGVVCLVMIPYLIIKTTMED